MSRESNVPHRRYTDEFKLDAVKLAEAVGGTEAARRLGIPDSSLFNWVRLDRTGKLSVRASGSGSAKRVPSELEAENARLRRELASAKLDVDILKKAAAYFANESQ